MESAATAPLAEFQNTVLHHRRSTASGWTEDTVLDLTGQSFAILPGDFIGMHAGGAGVYRFYHELAAWLQGLRKPTAGTLRIFGKEPLLPHAASAKAARVFREGGVLPDLTVYENVELALAFSSLSRKEMAQRTNEALERFSLANYKNAYPGTDDVGRGAEKRLNYARAWARRPLLLFIDQPFLHIRDRYAAQAVEAVNELIAAGGAVMFTTNREHDLYPGTGGRTQWQPTRRYRLDQGKLIEKVERTHSIE